MRTSIADTLFENQSPGAGQTITLAYGRANFSNSLASYSVMKVQAPFIRASAANSGKKHGRQIAQPAGAQEINGVIVSGQVEHANGTVILLQSSWKRGGSPVKDAALFIRLRHGAPLYRIDAYVPTERENVIGDRFTMFMGMGDITGADELGLLGIHPNRSYVTKFMLDEEVEECFELHQLQSGTVGRPQLSAISTPTGVELREIPTGPTRRLNFRRRPT